VAGAENELPFKIEETAFDPVQGMAGMGAGIAIGEHSPSLSDQHQA